MWYELEGARPLNCLWTAKPPQATAFGECWRQWGVKKKGLDSYPRDKHARDEIGFTQWRHEVDSAFSGGMLSRQATKQEICTERLTKDVAPARLTWEKICNTWIWREIQEKERNDEKACTEDYLTCTPDKSEESTPKISESDINDANKLMKLTIHTASYRLTKPPKAMRQAQLDNIALVPCFPPLP